MSEADAHAMLESAIAEQSALHAQEKAASEAIDRAEKARAELEQIEADGDTLTAEGAQIEKEIAEGKFLEAETHVANAEAALRQAKQARDAAASASREASIRHGGAMRRDSDRAEAELQAQGAAGRAEALREAAQATDNVLAEQLAAVMPQGLLVRSGRLAVERGGREVSFGELSEGERWKIALDIAIEAMGGEGIVPIEQGAWEGLDGDARRAIAEHAQERGVLILTAEADHGEVGPLRAERLE